MDGPVSGYGIPGGCGAGGNLYSETALPALRVSGVRGSECLDFSFDGTFGLAGVPSGVCSFADLSLLDGYTKPTKNVGKVCEKRRK